MVNEKSLANLKPFQKGENSKLRGHAKKGERISTLAQKMLDDPYPGNPKYTYRQAIAKAMLNLAAQGDVQILRELLDRTEGKVTQKLQAEENVTIKYRAEDLTDDQLATVLARGSSRVVAPSVGPVSSN
jgi:hypothetical protein